MRFLHIAMEGKKYFHLNRTYSVYRIVSSYKFLEMVTANVAMMRFAPSPQSILDSCLRKGINTTHCQPLKFAASTVAIWVAAIISCSFLPQKCEMSRRRSKVMNKWEGVWETNLTYFMILLSLKQMNQDRIDLRMPKNVNNCPKRSVGW